CIWRSRDDFHVLYRIDGNLRGECLTLLITNRLSIDCEGGLSVIAERMKESVRISYHTGGRKDNRIAQPRSRRENWQPINYRNIDVSVCVRDVLENVFCTGLDFDRFRDSRHRQHDF